AGVALRCVALARWRALRLAGVALGSGCVRALARVAFGWRCVWLVLRLARAALAGSRCVIQGDTTQLDGLIRGGVADVLGRRAHGYP
ncbi:MAG TPA: hypothetical protein VGD29_15430, partial [Actinoplanes sp.]